MYVRTWSPSQWLEDGSQVFMTDNIDSSQISLIDYIIFILWFQCIWDDLSDICFFVFQ